MFIPNSRIVSRLADCHISGYNDENFENLLKEDNGIDTQPTENDKLSRMEACINDIMGDESRDVTKLQTNMQLQPGVQANGQANASANGQANTSANMQTNMPSDARSESFRSMRSLVPYARGPLNTQTSNMPTSGMQSFMHPYSNITDTQAANMHAIQQAYTPSSYAQSSGMQSPYGSSLTSCTSPYPFVNNAIAPANAHYPTAGEYNPASIIGQQQQKQRFIITLICCICVFVIMFVIMFASFYCYSNNLTMQLSTLENKMNGGNQQPIIITQPVPQEHAYDRTTDRTRESEPVSNSVWLTPIEK